MDKKVQAVLNRIKKAKFGNGFVPDLILEQMREYIASDRVSLKTDTIDEFMWELFNYVAHSPAWTSHVWNSFEDPNPKPNLGMAEHHKIAQTARFTSDMMHEIFTVTKHHGFTYQ